MSGRGGVPAPGRFLSWLLARKLDRGQRAQVLGELEELYEHRHDTQGPDAALAWLRREHRRLTRSLALGSTLVGPAGTTVLGPHPSDWNGLSLDVRHSLRGLRRTPGFTVALVVIVALGIGGTTLVYSVVHSVLIAPLPYPDADRLVLLRTINGEDMWSTSMADLDAIYDAPPAFDAIAGYSYRTTRLALPDGVELLRTKSVTDNYFDFLGIDPIAGRDFTPDEGRPGGANSVLLTRSYATRVLGSVEGAPGSSLNIDGVPHTIVGVLPDRLGPLDEGVDVFPVMRVETPTRKGPFFILTVGRLRDGVDPAVARSQLAAISERMFPIWQDSFTQEEAVIGFVDLKEILVGDVARTLLIVLAAVAFLLLIACANAASLLIARGVTRLREVSVRAALGASELRLFRLLLVEAAILAASGAVIGGALAWSGVSMVRRLGVGQLPRVDEVAMSPAVLGFFLAVALASWAVFGLVAAASVLRGRGNQGTATATRTTPSAAARLLRRGLVSLQFAISIPLLVGAGLLVASLDRLQNESFGFDPEGLVSVQVALPTEGYPDEEAVLAFWNSVLPDIKALPGVRAAGLADARPPIEYPHENNFEIEGRPSGAGTPVVMAPWITADSGFFSTYGIRTIEGRLFNDPADTMRTAVVDEAWVRRFHPEGSPLGARFRSGGCTVDGCPWIEIVGVVAGVKTAGLEDRRRLGTIYYDFLRDSYSSTNLHLRTAGPPLDIIPAVRRMIADRDPTIPFANVTTVDDLTAESIMGRRYTSVLVALLAAVALLLSVVGIYGAMSYFVRQHSRDIGIRIALGAAPEGALRLVVGQGMRVAGLGTLVGVLAALGLTRYMSALLYDVPARDPRVFVPIGLLTLLIALVATAIPGRAAASTDPAITLRDE